LPYRNCGFGPGGRGKVRLDPTTLKRITEAAAATESVIVKEETMALAKDSLSVEVVKNLQGGKLLSCYI
jgi:hypothetical protein